MMNLKKALIVFAVVEFLVFVIIGLAQAGKL